MSPYAAGRGQLGGQRPARCPHPAARGHLPVKAKGASFAYAHAIAPHHTCRRHQSQLAVPGGRVSPPATWQPGGNRLMHLRGKKGVVRGSRQLGNGSLSRWLVGRGVANEDRDGDLVPVRQRVEANVVGGAGLAVSGARGSSLVVNRRAGWQGALDAPLTGTDSKQWLLEELGARRKKAEPLACHRAEEGDRGRGRCRVLVKAKRCFLCLCS